MSDVKVTSEARASENHKADEELKKLRESAKKDKEKAKKASEDREERERLAREEARRAKEEARKKAEAARKAAEKARKEKEQAFKKKAGQAAAAAGGVVLNELAKKDTSKQAKKRILLFVAAVVVILGIGYLFFKPQIFHLLGLDVPAETVAEVDESLPETDMGYNKIDFTNAVLGKAREESKLIVMEQDVEVDSEISNALANISVFKKTKKIHTVGTGYYTVDLNGFSEDNVSVDEDAKTVTITIPHTLLDHTEIDPDKTTFEETGHAILGLGDIKLTQEQQNTLDRSIKDSIEAELNNAELYEKADETACLKVRKLFQPVVSSVSEEFVVEVVQD